MLRAVASAGNWKVELTEGNGNEIQRNIYSFARYFREDKMDVKRTNDHGYSSCIAGEGVMDFKAIYAELKKAGYDGYLSLEYEAQEDNKIGVERSIKHIKKILQEIKA